MSSWQQQQQGYRRPRDNNWGGGGGGGHGNGRGHGDGRRHGEEPEMDDGNHFVVRTRSLFLGGPQALEPPSVLGSFSTDSENNIHFNDSMMPVLSQKYIPRGNACMQVELDLNKGWHRVNNYTGSLGETFKQFLQWILEHQKELTAEDSSNKLKADFLCTRMVLRNIMQAPYAGSKNSDITILAQYFKGSVYMVVEENHGEHKEEQPPSLLEIYGTKFEQYMTGGDPDEVLDCNCQYRCILKLHLNELVLLYPTAVDAIDQTLHQHNFKDMSSFVRLKASLERVEPFKQWTYKKYTLNEWWIANQLSGTPRLLRGIRNPDGVVHTLEMLQTNEIPNQAEGEWEPSVCINFLVKFLNFVKEKVVAEPHQVHRFERSASAYRYIRHSHDTNVTDILPTWYKQKLFVSEEEYSD